MRFTAASEKRYRPRVVIVGAGFGGLWTARALARAPVEVLLIDRHNYHTFLPLLYQVAAAELEPEEIAYPVRGILRRLPNATFVMAEVQGIDFTRRLVEADGLRVSYDFLVLATGSTTRYFGIPDAAEHTFPLKTLEDGVALRNHILTCFERAVHEPDEARKRALLTFTIVGGGPTGVEFAGALAELLYGPLAKDYPELNFRKVRVVLLEARDTLLPGLPTPLQRYAARRLQQMGVDIRLGAAVIRITPQAVHLKDGTCISTETVVWTAGVQGAPQVQAWGLPVGRNGRVLVTPSLQVPDHPEVFVVGDLAYLEEGGRPLPMMAPVAIQQGETAGRNILRLIAGQRPQPFQYRDRGTMVTIGRNAAVAHVFGRSLTGFPAWVAWLSVHLFNLIGFRNRLFVMLNWAWDYFLYERAVRLILPAAVPRILPSQRKEGREGLE